MKRLLAALLLGGCGSPADAPPHVEPAMRASEPWSDAWILAEGQRYLDDDDFRRSALEASITEPTNVYSATRLSAYGLGSRGWDGLPEWTPRVHAVDASVVDGLRASREVRLPDQAAPLWNGVRPTSFEGWAALGRRVFFEYPLRPEPQAAHALARPSLAQEVGLVEVAGVWPGVVAFEDIDGAAKVGITCALCHVSVERGAAIEGRARRSLDYGRMRLAWHEQTGAPVSAELADRMRSWGPGRADITADDDEDPVAIVDLWGLRELRHLTQAATLTHGHPAALAIRQETQILHANRERTRPPRELAWALAVYLYALTPPPARGGGDARAIERGANVFADACASCHADPSGAGAPVAAKRVGTDANLATGAARGTGMYRPAPLIRVADAAPYLHDGSVGSLVALFGRERFRDDYRGPRGVGAVKGHAYGVDLSADTRDDLIAFLRAR